MVKKKVLGRGLSSFLTENINSIDKKNGSDFDKTTEKTITSVPIEDLVPNPDQPRKKFDEDDLKDLSNTIKDKGILQPLLVVRDGNYRYKIVAGERRWRAAHGAEQLYHRGPRAQQLLPPHLLRVPVRWEAAQGVASRQQLGQPGTADSVCRAKLAADQSRRHVLLQPEQHGAGIPILLQ